MIWYTFFFFFHILTVYRISSNIRIKSRPKYDIKSNKLNDIYLFISCLLMWWFLKGECGFKTVLCLHLLVMLGKAGQEKHGMWSVNYWSISSFEMFALPSEVTLITEKKLFVCFSLFPYLFLSISFFATPDEITAKYLDCTILKARPPQLLNFLKWKCVDFLQLFSLSKL